MLNEAYNKLALEELKKVQEMTQLTKREITLDQQHLLVSGVLTGMTFKQRKEF